ncbi:MAG: dihydrodipicolinate synthase family protein [Anaerolineales bacterium]
MSHELSGVYAAALTPLNKDLSPDVDLIPQYLAHLEKNGCHGALILGTTGEGPSFSKHERIAIMESARSYKETHPEFKLLVGTGTVNINETIELTEHSFSLGFNGVVVLPPYYYRKIDDRSLFEWYQLIIENAVPEDGYLLAYNIPSMTGISFSLDLLMKLKERFSRQFAGIKDSSSDEQYCRDLGERFGSDLLVLNGNDKLFSLALEKQAQGCITALANLYSPLLRKVWDGFQKAENTEEMQQKITIYRTILEKYAPYACPLKAMMNSMFGFPLSPVKPPLLNLDSSQRDQIYQEFVST